MLLSSNSGLTREGCGERMQVWQAEGEDKVSLILQLPVEVPSW